MLDVKVGDIVLFTTDKSKCDGWNSVGLMDGYLGTVQKIKRISFSNLYIENDERGWMFNHKNVECIVKDSSKEYPELRPYNFYVKCVSTNERDISVNFVYKVENGKIYIYNEEYALYDIFPIDCDYKLRDIQDVNDYFNCDIVSGTRRKESYYNRNEKSLFVYASIDDLREYLSVKIGAIDA